MVRWLNRKERVMKPKTIWVLLSVANEYDQPNNNLETWWESKPSFSKLANNMGIPFDIKKGNFTIGKLLNGETVRVYNTDYRL